jgi:hypothetical protein
METKIQKLGKRNTYTPTNASQVCSSVVMSLNREETLGEHNLKTSPNNPDVNRLSGKTKQNLRVFVINMRKKPLMPCSPAKASRLLRDGNAKVVSCKPFTIQLTKATGETKQEISLGIDSGYKEVGYSVITEKQELLSGELTLRTDISKKLSERKMYRRNRRNKLWYRKPRFLNRTSTKKEGWLAPSIQYKVDSHIRLIEKIKSILPISRTIIEIAKFDTQKLQNIDIEGVEYQQGQMKDYDNLREFILSRDKHTCQICKKKDGIFDIHHIIQRKDGGSNRPDNLVCVHTKCHKDFHSGKVKHKFTKPKSFKETSIMNNIRKYIVDKIGCDYTFGYITKRKRKELGLDKTHYNDAFVIANGSNQDRCNVVIARCIRRNNRQLQLNRKGFKPSIRRQRYKIQPGDIVKYKNKLYLTKGCHNKGSRAIIVFNGKPKSVSVKQLEVKSHGKGIIFNTRQFLTHLKECVSLTQTI